MAQTPDLLTSAEACDLLSIDRSTLSRWVGSGRIEPAMKAAGIRGPFVFLRSEVERVLAELATAKAEASA